VEDVAFLIFIHAEGVVIASLSAEAMTQAMEHAAHPAFRRKRLDIPGIATPALGITLTAWWTAVRFVAAVSTTARDVEK
jgi:hypothetical protein